MYLSKKFGPRLKSFSGQNMKIKESLHLGTGRSVHLLEVSGKTFLIGSTSGNINLLGDVSGSFAEHMEKFSKESDDAI
jgi:flagellar biosynthetic protein FliO